MSVGFFASNESVATSAPVRLTANARAESPESLCIQKTSGLIALLAIPDTSSSSGASTWPDVIAPPPGRHAAPPSTRCEGGPTSSEPELEAGELEPPQEHDTRAAALVSAAAFIKEAAARSRAAR